MVLHVVQHVPLVDHELLVAVLQSPPYVLHASSMCRLHVSLPCESATRAQLYGLRGGGAKDESTYLITNRTVLLELRLKVSG